MKGLNQANYMEGLILNRFLRLALLILITVNIVIVFIAATMYPPLLTLPNSSYYVLKLLVTLLLYIVIVFLATKTSTNLIILRIGTLFGIAASTLEIVHILIENYGHLNQSAESLSTGLFMAGLVLIFGSSGFVYAYHKETTTGGNICWLLECCCMYVDGNDIWAIAPILGF
jgi:hypothetical protein